MTSFLDELRQQPSVLRELAAAYSGPLSLRLDAAKATATRVPGPIVLAGMGSSNWAAEYGVLMLGEHGRQAAVWEAGELLHYGEVAEESLLVLISQSGESAETVALARKYQGRRAMVANKGVSPVSLC